MASKSVRRPFPGPPPASPSNSSHSSSSSSTAGSFSDSSSNSGSSFWSERSLSTSLARLFLNDYRLKGSGSLPFSHQNSKTENTSSLLSGRELHKQSQTIKESENGKATEEVGTQTAHEIAENVSSRDKISQTHRRKTLPAGLPVAGDGLLRTLLSKSAQSVPALFALSGVDAIDYSQSGEDAEKRGNSAANSDGGKQLVRRRSFSRKSLLVPDRVVRRQSVPPRRGPPPSFRVAKMNIKKQQQQAGKQQQSSALPPITETRVVARGRLPFAKAAKKKAVAVDWTGVPKLVGGWRKRQGRKSGNGNNNAVLGRKPVEDNANLMKGAKRVVIINRIGRRKPKVISAKSAAMEEDEMEAENWQMKENNNKREKHRRLAAVDGDGTLAKSSFQQQPLPIRPVKGRVLRPMLDKNQIKGKNQAFWANPPTGKPFITGKAPELFSKPVFLNSLPRPVLK